MNAATLPGIKAIIFDMDGVLVDSEPHHIKVEKKLFKQFGLNITREEHLSYMGKASILMWEEIKNRYLLPQPVESIVKLSDKESLKYFSSLESIETTPGLINLLDLARNKSIPMAVASSSPPEVIEIIMDKTGLREYFSHITSSHIVGKSKPEPDVFLHAAKLLGVKPEECMVIEDSTNGIKAAKLANMFCVAYSGTGAEFQDQGKADIFIHEYSQLEEVLNTLA